ncbi:Armadillo-like helical [Artemisia annua]|uniref:Armadillo-like helical n=1 Tax=Artemisia annua TaxID=35608 RepID=A0A2U1M5G2_ARTAN|nr:Armadillo-like helical [Artemisia annua]
MKFDVISVFEKASDTKKSSIGAFSLKFDVHKKRQGLRKDRTCEDSTWQLSRFYPMIEAEDWGDGGIMKWLRDEMNSYPDIIPSFLELLRVLPEEVFNYKIAARPDRRRKFE